MVKNAISKLHPYQNCRRGHFGVHKGGKKKKKDVKTGDIIAL